MKKNIFYYVILLIAGILLSSCSVKITMTAHVDDSGNLIFSSEIGKNLRDTILSFTAGSTNTSLYDAETIKSQLEETGLQNVIVSVKNDTNLTISGKIQNVNEGFKSVPDMVSTETLADGKKILKLNISPEILQQAQKVFPEDVSSYIDLLMAPVFTGEQMTEDEYIDLIESVYGSSIAQEIKKGTIDIILKSSNGTSSNYSMKITELLTLQSKKVFSLTLKNQK